MFALSQIISQGQACSKWRLILKPSRYGERWVLKSRIISVNFDWWEWCKIALIHLAWILRRAAPLARWSKMQLACIIRKFAQCTNELQNENCIMRIINVILTQSMFSIFRIHLLRQVVYIFFSTSYPFLCYRFKMHILENGNECQVFLLSCTFSTW